MSKVTVIILVIILKRILLRCLERSYFGFLVMSMFSGVFRLWFSRVFSSVRLVRVSLI